MPDASTDTRRLRSWEHCTEPPLTVAALLFLAVYAWEVIADLHGGQRSTAELILNGIWMAFAIDFGVRLVLAPDRGQWLAHHLLDLAAVVLPMLRPLRLLRLVTLLGVLQRSAGTALRGKITIYTVGSVMLLSLIAALAVLDAERHVPGASITSFGDALWWALVTITTVGYGDLAPVTPLGRGAAILLMIGGVALIGVVTATLASWIVSLVTEESAEQEAATRAQVESLREEIRALRAQIEAHGD
ncbi:potassium channel family protein [Actinomyces procaprae]|uniref:potassium channel family protein n=1 Tax=Actinomyces procaprae TaxID=2560010 RepID=UPI0010A26A68|nr:potassium channel family protein [Actinomyces procaprae]